MITELLVSNIRAFRDKDWAFEFSPLTVLCGTNSAGKSTLIKTLLLLKQSQGRRRQVARPRFVGRYVDLGDYSSLVSYGEVKRDIKIGITVRDKTLASNLRLFFRQDLPIADDEEQNFVEYSLKAAFIFRIPRSSTLINGQLADGTIEDDLKTSGYLHSASYSLGLDDKEIFAWEIGYRDSSKDTFPDLPSHELIIPRGYFRQIRLPKDIQEQIRKTNRSFRFPVVLDGFFPAMFVTTPVESDASKEETETARATFIPIDLIPQIAEPLGSLTSALESLGHAAPIRSSAKRYYLPDDYDNRMDALGNFVPFMLRDSKRYEVQDFPLDATSPQLRPLSSALQSWLNFFRTGQRTFADTEAQEIVIDVDKAPLIEVSLRSPSGSSLHPMLDSGVGLSQVLPILLLLLRARSNTTTLIEQPELHLNPALQVKLAEFFVQMAKAGKQIVLETHSEHIVNTIRVLAAEDETGEIADKSRIYFLDAGESMPDVKSLSIRPDGTVPDWPASFFGESLNLSGRLLRAQKRFRVRS